MMWHSMSITVGLTGEPDDRAIPTTVAPERRCDFCSATPTTHWLSFKPVPRRSRLVLPYYLGACSQCAERLDFRDRGDLVKRGACYRDEAKMIARYLDRVTPGS